MGSIADLLARYRTVFDWSGYPISRFSNVPYS
jgi:hypothetical protein